MENQVSLVRTFLSDPGSESEIGRLWGWGSKQDPDFGVSKRTFSPAPVRGGRTWAVAI